MLCDSNFAKSSKSDNCEIYDTDSFVDLNMNKKVSKSDESLNSESSCTEENVNEIEENIDMRTDEQFEIDDTESLLKLRKTNEDIAAACFEENDESVNCKINRVNNIELKVNKTNSDIEVKTDEDFEEIIKKNCLQRCPREYIDLHSWFVCKSISLKKFL